MIHEMVKHKTIVSVDIKGFRFRACFYTIDYVASLHKSYDTACVLVVKSERDMYVKSVFLKKPKRTRIFGVSHE